MMSKLVVPCIAEFPRLDKPRRYASEGFPAVRLGVAHEWLVHEFGEGELARVEGLPLDAIVSLYPEGKDVVFFSLARGTTMLEDLQVVLDAVARAVSVDDPTVVRELGKVRQLGIQNMEKETTIVPSDIWLTAPEPFGLQVDITWAIEQVFKDNGNFIDLVWFELYKLGTFVCAPLLIRAESRAIYLSGEPDWEPMFAALGLEDLWVKASARVEGWLSGDDDV